METVIYEKFPNCAGEIRHRVFVEEQGFQEEFDEIDHTAVHIVMFDEGKIPVATCRVFWDTQMNAYVLGRLAVIKKYRGKNIGSIIVKKVEKYVKEYNGKCIALHAQCRAAAFYRKLGFTEFGDTEDVEGCPHVWMRKSL